MKRQFEVPPYSKQVSAGSQVEMRCHPPKGKPTPTVAWAKNGRGLEPGTKDKNFLVTGEGHLIIVNPKISDSANYTCIAENIATRRESYPATLTVYGKKCLATE